MAFLKPINHLKAINMGFFQNLFGQNKQTKKYVPSSDLMNEDEFWNIIKITFEKSKGNFEKQQNELSKILNKTNLQDIILFDNRFRELRGKLIFMNFGEQSISLTVAVAMIALQISEIG